MGRNAFKSLDCALSCPLCAIAAWAGGAADAMTNALANNHDGGRQ